MKKNKKLGCISLLMFSPLAVAMQPMDDSSLAQTTGQDGINIGLNISKAQLSQVSVIDRDGFGTLVNDTNKASLVMAGKDATTAGQKFDISFVGASASIPTVNMVIDTDGGNGTPFANISMGFGSNITGIKTSAFGLYFAGANSTSGPSSAKSIFTGTSKNADVQKFFTADNGIDINFGPVKPKIILQLGNVPQSKLMAFSGSISSICGTGSGCAITLVSDGGANDSVNDVGAKFNFQFKATDLTNGFSLNNFYAGVVPTGFVFGNTGESSQFDVSLNQMIMGTSGASAAGTFNGLQNGSMGNFGAIGASVTDLKVKINGL